MVDNILQKGSGRGGGGWWEKSIPVAMLILKIELIFHGIVLSSSFSVLLHAAIFKAVFCISVQKCAISGVNCVHPCSCYCLIPQVGVARHEQPQMVIEQFFCSYPGSEPSNY